MGLFSKNKKNDMRPLSETEIQNKLYGELRSKESPRTSFPKPAGSQPQVKIPFTPPQKQPEHPDPEPEYNPPITTEEESSVDDFSESRLSPRQDLFDLPATEIPGHQKLPPRPPASLTPAPRPERSVKAAKPAIEPVRPVRKEEPRRTLTPEQQAELARQKELRSQAVKETGAKLASSFAIAAKTLLSVLVLFFVFVFKAFSLIDFRKPMVRRVLYWAGGIAALVVLFGAVHQLNVRREAAMQARPAAEPAETRRDTEREARGQEPPAAPAKEKSEPRREEPRRQEKKEAAPEAADKRYVIQVATYATPEDAEGLVKEFEGSGLKAFSKSLGRPGGRTYFSVFVGRFKDYQEAQREFEKFRANPAAGPFQDAFIRTLD